MVAGTVITNIALCKSYTMRVADSFCTKENGNISIVGLLSSAHLTAQKAGQLNGNGKPQSTELTEINSNNISGRQTGRSAHISDSKRKEKCSIV